MKNIQAIALFCSILFVRCVAINATNESGSPRPPGWLKENNAANTGNDQHKHGGRSEESSDNGWENGMSTSAWGAVIGGILLVIVVTIALCFCGDFCMPCCADEVGNCCRTCTRRRGQAYRGETDQNRCFPWSWQRTGNNRNTDFMQGVRVCGGECSRGGGTNFMQGQRVTYTLPDSEPLINTLPWAQQNFTPAYMVPEE